MSRQTLYLAIGVVLIVLIAAGAFTFVRQQNNEPTTCADLYNPSSQAYKACIESEG